MARLAWAPLILLLCGCGSAIAVASRPADPVAPNGFRQLTYRNVRVALRAPRDWTVQSVSPPLATVISSGPAVIALWRFHRPGPTPVTRPELSAARTALIRAVRERDPGLRLLGSKLLDVDGAGAVRIDAIESIGGSMRRVLSEHIYVPAFELVLEEYAPTVLFGPVEREVFSRVAGSLHLLTGRAA